LVGSAALSEADARKLREAVIGLADSAVGRGLLGDVCLTGFAHVTLAAYDETLQLMTATPG
jgi:hypothetical protein